MSVVSPKENSTILSQTYGDSFGMSVELHLQKSQKWRAKKIGGYWWLSRKGTGIRLRLTDAAMNRMFEKVNENMFLVYSRHVRSGIETYLGSFSTMEEAVSKIRQCYNIDVEIRAKDEYYYFVKEDRR